jgi:Ca2+-transporting ATPase
MILKEDFLNNLIYAGMIGFFDPPRLDIKDAILSCSRGIKIVMITGDHPMTALNIAKVGLADDADQHVITGNDMPDMNSV